MLFQELSQIAHVAGITGFIAVLFAWLIIVIILIKAYTEKSIILLEFGITAFCTTSPWYPSIIGYVYYMITESLLSYEMYIWVGNLVLPIAIIFWLDIYTKMIKPDKRLLILISYAIFSMIFYIYLYYFMYLAPGAPVDTIIGVIDDPTNPFDIDYKAFVLVYLSVSTFVAVGTGIHFGMKSLVLEDKELQIKGKFIIFGFIFYGVAAVSDAIVPMSELSLVIFRIFLVMASIGLYIGFVLPKWAKRILISNE